MTTITHRTLLAFVAAAVALAGTIAPANAQQQQGKKKNTDAQPAAVRPEKNPSPNARQPKQPRAVNQSQNRVEQVQEPQTRQNPNRQARQAEPVQRQPKQVERPARIAKPAPAVTESRQQPRTIVRPAPIVVTPEPVTVPARPRTGSREVARVPETQQKQLIVEQQRRVVVYDRRLQDQQRIAEQRARILQQQRRLAQYRYQQQYLEQLRQQQIWLAQHRNYNYYDDPYFYTPPVYRYYYLGSWRPINPYGANLLQQAVRYGYEEGFEAGRADRDDRWRFGFQDSWAYQDANYGYNGFYVDQSEYNYYFREGFRRGYEDGYYGRYQYGTYSNGTLAILGTVLNTILAFRSL